MRKALPADRDVQFAHTPEVGLLQASRHMLLGEKDLPRSGPSVARHRFNRRCNVRIWPSANCPAGFRCKASNSVFASRPGFVATCSRTSSHTSVKGSGLVRQLRSCFRSLGRRVYFSTPVPYSAPSRLLPPPRLGSSLLSTPFLTSLICSSVTIRERSTAPMVVSSCRNTAVLVTVDPQI